MARQNQETITMFGEVLHSSNISYSQNRSSSNDNRLMIYFQGMKATKREKIKLEQISREYRQIPKEKDADDFAYKNMKKAIEKLENHLKNIKTRS